MKRIEWIDIAKLVGMILVIIGHTITFAFPRGLIYSFHMPLFFALSMATFKFSNNTEEFTKKIKKGLKMLVLPALITWVIIVIILAIQSPAAAKDIAWWEDKILGFLYSAGYKQAGTTTVIGGLPAIWFLLALFIGKTFIDGLNLFLKNKKALIACTFVLCLIGYLFGKLPTFLPFGLDIVLVCMPIFIFGTYLKKIDFKKKPLLNMLICMALWLLTLMLITNKSNSYRYMDIFFRNYPYFPLCFIPSIFGCLFIAYLCYFISLIKFKAIKAPLLILGRNTLYLVCIHSIDEKVIYWPYIQPLALDQWILALIRIGINIGILIIVLLFIALLKKVIRNIKSKKTTQTI